MLTKSLLGLSLAAVITLPTWADTTQWGRWSTIRFPARVDEMLSTGFYARTPSGSELYIRQDQRVLRDGQLVNPAFLRPGDNVQVEVPAGKGQIRIRDDNVAVLSTPQGLAQVPDQNLQLAYQDPYTTSALQPAGSSNSNYYLGTPNSGARYASDNFYSPSPAYYPTNYQQPYAYNSYTNSNSSFSWEGAAVSLLGTVLANTLGNNNSNGYGQGYNPYDSGYNQSNNAYSPYAGNQGYDPYSSGSNQGYSTSPNYNYNYANYTSTAYSPNNWMPLVAFGVNRFLPQVQVSNWNANNYYTEQVQPNYYRPQVPMNNWNGSNYRVNNNNLGKHWKQKYGGANYYQPQVQMNNWNRNNYRVKNNKPGKPWKQKKAGANYYRPQVQMTNWNRNTHRVFKQRPQVRVSNWNRNTYRVQKTPKVHLNSYRPSYQQPRNDNRTPREQTFHGGSRFYSAPQQRNFNRGGGHGGGHQGGGEGHHRKGH